MKQKFKIILSVLLIFTIGITADYILFNESEEAFENDDEPKQIKEKYLLSYYLENDNGEYEVASAESWPTSGYVLNLTLSKCENGSEISWDEENKLVLFSGNSMDKCYIYFDKVLTFYFDDVLYYYKSDMSWEEWLNSSYSDSWSYKSQITEYSGPDSNICTSTEYYPYCFGKTINDNLFLIGSGDTAMALYITMSNDYGGHNPISTDTYTTTSSIIHRDGTINDNLQLLNNEYSGFPDFTINHFYIDSINSTCLTPNTLIDVEEIDEKGKKRRRRKKLKDIKVGDKVICINPVTLELDVDTVVECDGNMNKKHICYDNWYFDDETVITTVHRHRFYNVENSKFMYMEEWNIGDHGINIDNKKIKLIKHEHIEEEINHCTLFTKKYNNYFANGMLSGNRKSKNMKL